ncbi:MAG: reverse transcriptase domain-containing protein [Polyangiales bacterium]
MSPYFHNLKVTKSLRLNGSPEDLRAAFLKLQTPEELADLLDCSFQQLIYWTRLAPSGLRYSAFTISKANGERRTIEAPAKPLRTLLRKLLQVLEAVYEPKAATHGFVKGRSIATNATRHVRRAWVLNVDLSDFFPTIHFGRVRGIFRAKPYLLPDSVATTLAQLVCYNGKLPQGSPASPIVANILCARLDSEMSRFAKEHRAMYTRYADDLTLSVKRRGFPQAIARVTEPEAGTFHVALSDGLVDIVKANGFVINDSKVRIQPWKRSQRVTGLVVNQKVNVPRRFIRRTRAMLHAWEVHGIEAAQNRLEERYSGGMQNKSSPPSFMGRVRGNIAYIGQIRGRDDEIYIRFMTKYYALSGSAPVGRLAMKSVESMRDVFICHASEQKATVVELLVQALLEARVSCWYDKAEIKWGDSLSGKIDEGLANSAYVIVVLSKDSLEKSWPMSELNASMSREVREGKVRVLPLVVGTPGEIELIHGRLPLQSHKLYQVWTGDPVPVVEALKSRLGR